MPNQPTLPAGQQISEFLLDSAHHKANSSAGADGNHTGMDGMGMGDELPAAVVVSGLNHSDNGSVNRHLASFLRGTPGRHVATLSAKDCSTVGMMVKHIVQQLLCQTIVTGEDDEEAYDYNALRVKTERARREHLDWSMIWPLLKACGWRWAAGTGLATFKFVPPRRWVEGGSCGGGRGGGGRGRGGKDFGSAAARKKKEIKQDFDFGMPDPHPMDFTRCLHKLTGRVLHILLKRKA